MGYLCLAAVIAIPVLIGLGWRWWRLRRIAFFTRWGAERGFRYYEWDDRLTWLSEWEPFDASRETGRHVFHGRRRGRYVMFGELHSHKGNDRRLYQLVAVQLPAACPLLDVSFETAGSRLASLFGVRDLQLESQQFNETYKIDTSNDRFAYAVLTPQNMSWLLGDSRARLVGWRIEKDWLMTWRQGRFDVDDVMAYVNFMHDLAERLPGYLWRTLTPMPFS